MGERCTVQVAQARPLCRKTRIIDEMRVIAESGSRPRRSVMGSGAGMVGHCPYCGGVALHLVTSKDYNRGTTEETFEYQRCGECGLVFLREIPEDLQPYYAGGYAAIPRSLEELRAIAREEVYRLEPVLRHKRGGRLLEIGPWRGVFCLNAKEAGFEVSAIEMDEECVRFLREVVGVDAVQSMDPAAAMLGMSGKFDVIALWHSIEHLREPWVVVERAAERLAPGGLLIMALPNIESFEFAVLRERWRHLDAPRHLYFFPADMLTALGERYGLRTVEMKTHDRLSELMAKDTWVEWVKRWFGSNRFTERLMLMAYGWAKEREQGRRLPGSGITAVLRKG